MSQVNSWEVEGEVDLVMSQVIDLVLQTSSIEKLKEKLRFNLNLANRKKGNPLYLVDTPLN